MAHRLRMIAAFAAMLVTGLAAPAVPALALAPQPVDASDQGPLAFVLMTVMCVLFVLSLFYMDRVRQRHEDRESRK